jgi:hypothetical protein
MTTPAVQKPEDAEIAEKRARKAAKKEAKRLRKAEDVRLSELKEYRTTLVTLEEKMQAAYDGTVLTLSGGALGISLVIIKDIIGDKIIYAPLALAAWIFWILSMGAVLWSYAESAKSMSLMIAKVDADDVRKDTSHLLNRIIQLLNRWSGVFFLIGLVLFTCFVSFNIMSDKNDDVETRGANVPPPTTTIIQPTK